MSVRLLLHTLRHLRFRQVAGQIWFRVHRAKHGDYVAPHGVSPVEMHDWISKAECLGEDGRFEFLNISDEFRGWNDVSHGALWAYNLNYMDWLCQAKMSAEEGAQWIDRYISDIPTNKVGCDPYPTALRTINWCKFFSLYPQTATSDRINALYSQLVHLSRSLEFRLLGNHLLEDAYALYIGSRFIGIDALQRKAQKLLKSQLTEQILADGAHYEQSPMYHCILLDRLLDCINIGGHCEFADEVLRPTAVRMLGHLDSICYADDKIPLVNDSAEGIAPTPSALRAYARRLGIDWQPIALRECGYRKWQNDKFEVLVDVGNLTASYQPGHSHADTFNFEMRIDGKLFIVDTGISTYNKTPRRQYERSTAAHNTVTLADRSSSEVWGGFRVGNRAKVRIVEESDRSVTAVHNGFGRLGLHQRTFRAEGNAFYIQDKISKPTPAKAYLHFAPEVKVLEVGNAEIKTTLGNVKIDGADTVEIVDDEICREYNRFLPVKIAVLHFTEKLDVEIRATSF